MSDIFKKGSIGEKVYIVSNIPKLEDHVGVISEVNDNGDIIIKTTNNKIICILETTDKELLGNELVELILSIRDHAILDTIEQFKKTFKFKKLLT